ncbi:MAG: response regulator transcription factor [Chloroflexota bacterium]|nr:response regulator transcription factor [Chloroflexota bacterium]
MAASPLVGVLIIDDHTLVRTGLRMLIESSPKLKVVGEVDTYEEALGVVASEKPDIILLDLDDEGGMGCLTKLTGNGSRVIVITGMHENRVRHEIVRHGAMGLVGKKQPGDTLLKAIEKVSSGEFWFSRSLMAAVLHEMLNPKETPREESPIATLTDREQEVIEQVGKGLKNHEIGTQLHISESTVRHHLTSIYSKLGVSDRLELLIFAYQNNLVELPSTTLEA